MARTISRRRSASRKSRRDEPYRVGRSRTGLGLFAIAAIAKGAFIIEYKGRRITHAQARRKEARGSRYLFEVSRRCFIDGSSRRNVARYANHSCRPNAESDLVKGKVILRAIKAVKPGEEITYDYGEEYFELFIKPTGCKCVKCANELQKRRRAQGNSAQRSRVARSGRT